ncbi:rhodanese domain-containing protein CG4456-like [Contarinia nasturtii]|uniref:rhodanese domain-containing protein CG4456-like n=1 Tax=Contarinia nasturtii TaxID=265458 RepID=UPI0012D4332D|nr:rhodanese domain-containing protein CG4456-like [Contarinia nasturtii]
MTNRITFALSRKIPTLLNGHRYFQTNRFVSIFACNTQTGIFGQNYIINNENYSVVFKNMGQRYSTDNAQIVIPIVTYEDVKDLTNHPEKTLIDVREPNELQETGTIPTSINIPLGEVNTALNLSDSQFKKKYSRNKPGPTDEIIFHCKIGMRSENAAIAATKLGYTNAKNFKGSWLEWAEREGLPK